MIVQKSQINMKKETLTKFRVVYDTQEEISESASKILKSMQILFVG